MKCYSVDWKWCKSHFLSSPKDICPVSPSGH
nr:MAG TPA: hypothetical protein [Caudoviricetes sp.]